MAKNKKIKATLKSKKRFDLVPWLKMKLRRISYQFPVRKEVLGAARISRGVYRCAICKGENFGPKDIQLDHLVPVISPEDGFVDWNTYIDRLFCEADGWQVCCKGCHEAKSFLENQIRVQVKAEKRKDQIKDEDDI